MVSLKLENGAYTAEHVNLAKSSFNDVGLLTDASFINVNLSSARFDDVNLMGATINNVNMSNVAISNANLDGASIDGIQIKSLFRAYYNNT
jgi:uncharacterized protein YjbI with pentapeptide repeats